MKKFCFFYITLFRHGGIQRVVVNFLNQLSKNHDVTVVFTDTVDITKNYYELDLKKIKVIHLDYLYVDKLNYKIKKKICLILSRVFNKSHCINKICSNYYHNRQQQQTIVKFINDNNFDYIIGCSIDFNMFLGSIKKAVNCKIIGWEHNSYVSYFNKGAYLYKKQLLCKNFLKNIDYYITLTEEDKIKYDKLLKNECKVIPNPLCLSNNNKSNLKNKKILWIGRLEKIKGPDLMLKIFEDFYERNPKWTLTMVGEGPMQNTLESMIEGKPFKNNIKIVPFSNDIATYFLESDIYACTSRFESFGLTVLEAMYFGLSVVTFDTVGPGSLLKNKNFGYVIRDFDVNEFSDKLLELSRNTNILNDNSKNAIKESEKYTIEVILKKWGDLLELSWDVQV